MQQGAGYGADLVTTAAPGDVEGSQAVRLAQQLDARLADVLAEADAQVSQVVAPAPSKEEVRRGFQGQWDVQLTFCGC